MLMTEVLIIVKQHVENFSNTNPLFLLHHILETCYQHQGLLENQHPKIQKFIEATSSINNFLQKFFRFETPTFAGTHKP